MHKGNLIVTIAILIAIAVAGAYYTGYFGAPPAAEESETTS